MKMNEQTILAKIKIAAVINRYHFTRRLTQSILTNLGIDLRRARTFLIKNSYGDYEIKPAFIEQCDTALGLCLLENPGFLGTFKREYKEGLELLSQNCHTIAGQQIANWF
jgi:hypothetical protein